MSGSSFGTLFRISTFGESHGGALGVVVDGCPPGLSLSESDIQPELDRRKPGQSEITTPRKEEDTISILSGVFEGVTTGTPILLLARNKDARSEDYGVLKELYRPSHADFTYHQKYGVRDWRGSGRASARETLARVAAGAIAKKFLRERVGISIYSYVDQVGDIRYSVDPLSVRNDAIEASIVRCPDAAVSAAMAERIAAVLAEGDSIGGAIQGVVTGCPVGLGEPVFDKLHADLGKAMLSINAVKGFEVGEGFAAASMLGSEHNDPFSLHPDHGAAPVTNHAGGVLGGISTGAPILFRVAFKPVATIRKPQRTVTLAGEETTLEATGRHDPCVVPRAVPIVDGMAALVLMDHYLRHYARRPTA
jgi:chorismate synthase